MHPFFSIQRLQYVDEMSYKLERRIHEVKFNDTMMNGSKSCEKEECITPFGTMKTWNLSKT